MSTTPSAPDYRRVVDDIAGKIAKGALPRGSELPSYRELSIEYDVSVSTIQRALLILRERGLIEGRQGRGTYVAEKPADSATADGASSGGTGDATS